jgi:hypothetical protein
MAQADNYRLVVSAVAGIPYITRISKKNTQVMTDDRREIPKSEFIPAVIEWTKSQLNEGEDTLILFTMKDGKRIPLAEITLLKK